jgi:quinol-cytochrome oxidoreductase complex cytochrome b subunit
VVTEPGDRHRLRLRGALALPGWALIGTASSTYLLLESTGPVQAGTGTGIWLSSAPPETPPHGPGSAPSAPCCSPPVRLVLLSWAPIALFLLVSFTHRSGAKRPQWRPAVMAYALLVGTALGLLAVISYRLPAQLSSAPGPDGSAWTGYVRVPVINWYDIPAAIGFLIVALVMWRMLIPPERATTGQDSGPGPAPVTSPPLT